MAGRGPRPKDTDRLAGHGAAKARVAGMKVFTASPVQQPPLPSFSVTYCDDDGHVRTGKFVWPVITRRWWKTWGSEPMAKDFRPTDWDFLLDTALLHARVWGNGEMKHLPELRLRVAKMGATGEDRARLRITYAAADEADGKRDRQAGAVSSRYAGLRAVD